MLDLAAKAREEKRIEDIKQRFEQTVFLLAYGIVEKERLYEESPRRYPYCSEYRHGLSMFASLCAECCEDGGLKILDGLSESSFIRNYASRNVADWIEGWDEWAKAAVVDTPASVFGPLVVVDGDFFATSEECHELISLAEPDLVGGYQERMVYEFLRSSTQEQYVLGRRFLIRNPILSWDDHLAIRGCFYALEDDALEQGESANADWDWVNELVDLAYEEAPSASKKCPACGWTLVMRGIQPVCSHRSCVAAVPSDQSSLDDIPHDSLRLKRGVMSYIARPGRLEMQIAELAQQLGLSFELWPMKDTCDVLVTLPDGSRIAVDAKTFGSASKLAWEVEGDCAAERLGVDRFVYVVPDEVEREHPGYCRLCNGVLKGKRGYSCSTFSKFSAQLKASAKEL